MIVNRNIFKLTTFFLYGDKNIFWIMDRMPFHFYIFPNPGKSHVFMLINTGLGQTMKYWPPVIFYSNLYIWEEMYLEHL